MSASSSTSTSVNANADASTSANAYESANTSEDAYESATASAGSIKKEDDLDEAFAQFAAELDEAVDENEEEEEEETEEGEEKDGTALVGANIGAYKERKKEGEAGLKNENKKQAKRNGSIPNQGAGVTSDGNRSSSSSSSGVNGNGVVAAIAAPTLNREFLVKNTTMHSTTERKRKRENGNQQAQLPAPPDSSQSATAPNQHDYSLVGAQYDYKNEFNVKPPGTSVSNSNMGFSQSANGFPSRANPTNYQQQHPLFMMPPPHAYGQPQVQPPGQYGYVMDANPSSFPNPSEGMVNDPNFYAETIYGSQPPNTNVLNVASDIPTGYPQHHHPNHVYNQFAPASSSMYSNVATPNNTTTASNASTQPANAHTSSTNVNAGTETQEDSHQSQPKKKILRGIGDDVWEDPTLEAWHSRYRLFIGNLGNEVSESHLRQTFREYPSLDQMRVVRDNRTKKPKGYAFVSFTDGFEMLKAKREKQAKYCGNRPMKISVSKHDERDYRAQRKNKSKEDKDLQKISRVASKYEQS